MRGVGILAAGVAVVALATSGPVAAESVPVGELPHRTDFTVTPRALPERALAPSGLSFSTRLPASYASGAPVPATKEITLLVDRHLAFDFAGYPPCEKRLESPLPLPGIPDRCRRAVIGSGSASFLIRFPDSEPVAQSSRLFLINDGRASGTWTLFAHTEIDIPVPAKIVTTIKIKPIRKGRYGTQWTMTVPKVAGGSGLLTSLSFKLNKRFQRHGRKVSVVNARCPDGKLLLRTTVTFADDTRAQNDATTPCTALPGR